MLRIIYIRISIEYDVPTVTVNVMYSIIYLWYPSVFFEAVFFSCRTPHLLGACRRLTCAYTDSELCFCVVIIYIAPFHRATQVKVRNLKYNNSK